jgi:hypothetical protein
MANSVFNLTVTTNNNAVTKGLVPIAGDNYLPLTKIKHFFTKAVLGVWNSSTYVTTNMVAATGTITFSSIANNDTVTVNGRVYTAKTSGATGLQQFNIGGSDTAAATNFALAVNADTSILVAGVVKAAAVAAVTTITSLVPGNIGNLSTIAISAHGSVSGANLTGGSQGSSGTITHGL